MTPSSHISKTEKKQLVSDFEKEKEKIVADKVQNLQNREIQQQKQGIARAIEQEEENRKLQLQKSYKNQPSLIRFIYGLRSLLTKVPATELYHESLLADLRTQINKNGRGSILASNNMISGKFIAKLYSAYAQANELGDILKTMFKQQKSIELYTRYAFKRLYKEIEMKRSLSEFVDLMTMREKIREGGEALGEYMAEQRTIIRRAAKNLNPAFFNTLLGGLNDLYHLFLFISFDYKKFFISMGGKVNSLKSGKFDDWPIKLSMKFQLENFYQYVPMLAGLGSIEANREAARYIFACAELVRRQDEDQSLENITKTAQKDVQNYMKSFAEFCRTWNTTICNYPFQDLIRLSSLNSFYEVKPSESSSLQIKERVKKFIEQQLLFELELYTEQVREELNAAAKEKLLIDYESSILGYYSAGSTVNTGRFYGIPGFGHVNEINIIYNFLTKYYSRNIKKIFVYLIRTVLSKSTTLRTNLMNQSMGFDNLEERIRNFNSDLNPDRAWGRSLMNIIYRLEKNDTGNLVKQTRELIKEVDSEAEHLIAQAHKTFEAAVKYFQILIRSENAKLRQALKATIPDSQFTLLDGLEDSVHALVSIQSLVRSYCN